MRNLRELDKYRLVPVAETARPATEGAFQMKLDGQVIRIIASAEGGWDHVSVSCADRCPTWAEMDRVKRLFFKDSEAAMQLHVPISEHINTHPFVLHLWRSHTQPIPQPPRIMV